VYPNGGGSGLHARFAFALGSRLILGQNVKLPRSIALRHCRTVCIYVDRQSLGVRGLLFSLVQLQRSVSYRASGCSSYFWGSGTRSGEGCARMGEYHNPNPACLATAEGARRVYFPLSDGSYALAPESTSWKGGAESWEWNDPGRCDVEFEPE
jgi:hypothetical protein